ncbi:MAG: hypothetical protein ABL888_14535 [Pirellulaceae bacterium]
MTGKTLKPDATLFEGLIGREFSVTSREQPIRFQLVQVSKLRPATTRTDLGIRQNPFSLLFKEVTEFKPGQGTFTVNTDIGSIDLFLVPVGFGEYEAVFN